MRKITLASGCAVASLALASTVPAWAQVASSPSAPAAEPASDAPQAADAPAAAAANTDIIVTGSARAQRRFDVSYQINSLSQADIKQLAPKSFADLLGQLPGIHVETTGGEVQNITRLRGIPTDRGMLIFQQDGLPLYHEVDGYFFNSGDGMNRYDLMTERVEVVQGGPAPVYASEAAGIVNNITVSGTATPRGAAQLTIGDIGLYRADLMQSGPLGHDTYYAIGGFLRYSDGYRDNGFPNDRGGQIRANIKHDFGNGFVKVTANYLNDHNVFYLPIPIANPSNPSQSLNPWLNYFTGTMNSPAFRDVTLSYQDPNGALRSVNRDLADGRHMQYGNLGLQYQGDFDGWLVSFKGGATKGKNTFDALYSTTNPSDATAYANSYRAAATKAFGTVDHLGYVYAGTNTAYNPSTQSGLVMPAQYRAADSRFYSVQGDLSLTHKFATAFGTHDVKVGAYTSFYGDTQNQYYQQYLLQVQGQPATLDLIAYSASGAVLGKVTNNGALPGTNALGIGKVDAKMLAVYANDTWEITRGLRLDGGIRHEWYSYNGFEDYTKTVTNTALAGTLANTVVALTGTAYQFRLSPQVTNWTVGLSYDFTRHFGAYGRASHVEVPPTAGTAFSTAPTPTYTKANEYEFGVKASFGRNYLYATGYYTQFNPLNGSYPDPTTQYTTNVPFIGKAVSKGVEIDANLEPVRWFSLNGAITFADPQYDNLYNPNNPSQTIAVAGKQIIREPKLYGHVLPKFHFESGRNLFDIYGTLNFVGREYVDYLNTTQLPAYQTLGAGFNYTRGPWQFQVVGDNITNSHGLTEGNTRSDAFGQGTAVAVYGRPLFGRNFRFVVTRSW
ncbi:TonB-dependent receptor [Sphingomonas sp. 10B4]|uniref:TonB-dependent receptor n=1 Tax=Sphingomonas sp. 10B4 TaxID=3048575 RepID=UPI002AB373CC|nr:TonB-dependent receptor [Sphingomonas sp. 10B4]MDY7524573.1 TonB-dependent receptor [Sphingomonas sp. 10B4]MEB0283991.1 TonB-dependent receptor [Sphingomonas sp. 10B4]